MLFERAICWASAAAASLIFVPCNADAQPDWMKKFQARSTHYTAQQPRWPGPVFVSTPQLVQVLREDFAHQESGSTHLWNIGVGKGLQFVPLPRTEFTFAIPSHLRRVDEEPDGFGDFNCAVKYRLLGAPEKKGNYILSAQLGAAVPTGNDSNNSADAAVIPQLMGGKGWGRFDQSAAVLATLPVHNAGRNGHVFTAHTASQFHATKYVWPAIETTTTHWIGGRRDGQVQFLMGPSVIVGRLPYTRHEKDRRRGISLGAGYQVAVTHTHNVNHVFQITTRLHF
ncbi:transporter [Terriglobus sp.]|uniref:transporter n=1 Tax=Terriglobus sp. TaxID=1889013 RepID=UPI003B0012E3